MCLNEFCIGKPPQRLRGFIDMFKFEQNEGFTIRQQRALEAALSTNPNAEKAIRKLIREYILDVRKQIVSGIKFKHGDPRNAAESVRTTVYQQVLGANVNIYSSRRAHGSNSFEPARKGSTGRGGNRRTRSMRTQQVMSYAPLDRGFILRWQNVGTNDRKISFTHNDKRKMDTWNKHPNSGNRGRITAQNFFRRLGEPAMQWMEANLAAAIETELSDIMNRRK